MIGKNLKQIDSAFYYNHRNKSSLFSNRFFPISRKFTFPIERSGVRFFLLCATVSLFAHLALAQQTAIPRAQPSPTPSPSLEKRFLKNIVRDQAAIFTAPFRLRTKDARWLAPLGAATAGLIATDRRTAGALGDNRAQRRVSNAVSYLGSSYGAGAIAGGFYLFGRIKNDARARETGLLAGEALIDTGILVTVLKTSTQRMRPLSGDRRGLFFTKGNSFPSGHSAAAWSVATVVAHEYSDKPIVKYAAYGLATVVSLSRFSGRKHFLSDALVGSAIGYGIGRYVYRKHHDASLDSGGKSMTGGDSTSKLFPVIVPRFDRATRTYGANLQWNF